MLVRMRYYRSLARESRKNSYVVRMSPSLLRALKLASGREATLTCGRKSAQVTLVAYEFSGDDEYCLGISSSLRKYFYLPRVSRLHIRSEPGAKLKLGPVTAVVSGRGVQTGRIMIDLYMSRVVRRGIRDGNLSFIISAGDLRPQSTYAIGYYPVPLKSGGVQWKRRILPFPDVFFNRIPNRVQERMASSALVKLRRMPKVHLVNERFFNKWQIHRWLRDMPVASQHLPPTIRLGSRLRLFRFLRKYRKVYLKPIGGSKGIGIIRVKKLVSGYQFLFLVKRRVRSIKVQSRARAWRLIRYLTRKRTYIAQAAIPLARYRGRPYDIRVSMQKDTEGNWKVAGMAAKIAGSGRIATHLINGGRLCSVPRALSYSFRDRAEEIRQEIIDVMTKCSEELEEAFRRPLVELGWDIGIDRRGYCWILECNGHPGRVIFRLPSLRRSDLQSVDELNEYFQVAAGFGAD